MKKAINVLYQNFLGENFATCKFLAKQLETFLIYKILLFLFTVIMKFAGENKYSKLSLLETCKIRPFKINVELMIINS